MMRLINGGLYLSVVASYLICAGLVILGLLTVVVALFKDNPNGQVGGIGVMILAVLMAGTTAITMHAHRRSTR